MRNGFSAATYALSKHSPRNRAAVNEATISGAGESNRGMRRSCSIRECRWTRDKPTERGERKKGRMLIHGWQAIERVEERLCSGCRGDLDRWYRPVKPEGRGRGRGTESRWLYRSSTFRIKMAAVFGFESTGTRALSKFTHFFRCLPSCSRRSPAGTAKSPVEIFRLGYRSIGSAKPSFS